MKASYILLARKVMSLGIHTQRLTIAVNIQVARTMANTVSRGRVKHVNLK